MGNGNVGGALTYVVPRSLLKESAHVLRSLSDGVRESVVLWIGTEQAGKALVQRIAVPHQLASAERFDVPFDERARIIRELGNSARSCSSNCTRTPVGHFTQQPMIAWLFHAIPVRSRS